MQLAVRNGKNSFTELYKNILYNYYYYYYYNKWRILCGVVDKVLDYDIVTSEFEILLR